MINKVCKEHCSCAVSPPRFFFSAAANAIDEGSVLEVTLTTSTGKTLCTNLRVTAEDLQSVRELRQQLGK